MVVKRETYLIVSGPKEDPSRKHLFIICTSPCDEGKVVIVPVQTARGAHDKTVELAPHEHPFIKWQSYAAYYEAKVIEVSKIESLLKSGQATQHDDLNAQTFLRLRNGIEKSESTPPKVLKHYSENKGR